MASGFVRLALFGEGELCGDGEFGARAADLGLVAGEAVHHELTCGGKSLGMPTGDHVGNDFSIDLHGDGLGGLDLDTSAPEGLNARPVATFALRVDEAGDERSNELSRDAHLEDDDVEQAIVMTHPGTTSTSSWSMALFATRQAIPSRS